MLNTQTYKKIKDLGFATSKVNGYKLNRNLVECKNYPI